MEICKQDISVLIQCIHRDIVLDDREIDFEEKNKDFFLFERKKKGGKVTNRSQEQKIEK